mmetsp:Transcript_76253/g.88652  ORF Transcript_76253/g.88652 Transcript_76253/m.88652 type:complete len:267 (+) Transcript_76253:62-862(+)
MHLTRAVPTTMAAWAAHQFGPFPKRLDALLKQSNTEPEWLKHVVHQRLIDVREPILREASISGNTLRLCSESLVPLDEAAPSTQLLVADVTRALLSSDCHPSTSVELTCAERRIYELWDLIHVAKQHSVEKELNMGTYQTVLIEDYGTSELKGTSAFRCIGSYGYNDNVTMVVVDVEGKADRSAGMPMTLYAIDVWDDDYEFMEAADDAFIKTVIDSPTSAQFNENNSIHRVEPFEGSALEFLVKLRRHTATPDFFLNVAYPDRNM